MKNILLMLALALFSCNAFASTNLNETQAHYLSVAHRAGKAIGWPETMESIIWQESSVGRFKIGDDGKSLGLAHVQVRTAKAIMKQYQWVPQVKGDYKIAQKLIHDDNFNILIASLYFNDCYGEFHDWKRALVCYNGGASLASRVKYLDKFPYVINIKRRLKEVKIANREFGIGKRVRDKLAERQDYPYTLVVDRLSVNTGIVCSAYVYKLPVIKCTTVRKPIFKWKDYGYYEVRPVSLKKIVARIDNANRTNL